MMRWWEIDLRDAIAILFASVALSGFYIWGRHDGRRK